MSLHNFLALIQRTDKTIVDILTLYIVVGDLICYLGYIYDSGKRFYNPFKK